MCSWTPQILTALSQWQRSSQVAGVGDRSFRLPRPRRSRCILRRTARQRHQFLDRAETSVSGSRLYYVAAPDGVSMMEAAIRAGDAHSAEFCLVQEENGNALPGNRARQSRPGARQPLVRSEGAAAGPPYSDCHQPHDFALPLPMPLVGFRGALRVGDRGSVPRGGSGDGGAVLGSAETRVPSHGWPHAPRKRHGVGRYRYRPDRISGRR
jgi:hypothetical protein